MTMPERLVALEQDLGRFLDDQSPALLAVETLLFNQNVSTAMHVAEARGVIVLSGARRAIPIQDCAPSQVKMTVTGYGRADKAQVKQMIKLQLGLQTLPGLDDAIDAIGIAITGYHLHRSALTGGRSPA